MNEWFGIWTQTGRGVGLWRRIVCWLRGHDDAVSAYGGRWCRRCAGRWERVPVLTDNRPPPDNHR